MAGNYFDRFDEPAAKPKASPASAPAAADGNYFDRYSDPAEAAAGARREFGKKHPIARRLDAAARGAGDFLSMGWADEFAGTMNALPALMPGGETFGESQARHIAYERGIDEADRQDVPWSRRGGEAGGFVGTLGLGMLGAAAKGGPIVNTLRSTAAGAGLGGLASAGNAEGDLGERAKAAIPGAVVGGALGAAAVPVGAAVSAVAGRVAARAQPAVGRAANALRNRIDVDAARREASALREAGVEPAAIHVMDDAGRGYVAAAAKRQTPARDLVQQRADASRVNMPGRVSRQAERLSSDRRTPAQIAEQLSAERKATGDANFGAVRGERLPLTPDAVQALRSEDGRDAIRAAARASLRSLDPDERAIGAELNRLAGDAIDRPGQVQITVGMAQSISEALYDAADAAARSGRGRTAMDLGNLARAIRNNAADSVPGYRQALDEYAAQSRLMGAAETGEDFLKRNTDEFVADAPAQGTPGNALARATARRAIERRAGESPAAAMNTAESIAIAPEQQARTRAVLPEDEAAALERGMGAEVRTHRQLQQVAPRAGSPTNLNSQDERAAADLAGGVATILGGPKEWGRALIARLRTAGLSDDQAAAVADIATDPAQLDDLLSRMERMKPGSGAALRGLINDVAAPNAGEATQRRPSVSVAVEGKPELGVGAASDQYVPGVGWVKRDGGSQ